MLNTDSPPTRFEFKEARLPGQGTDLLDAALAYARLGWPVFPCGRDKRPLIKDWPRVATTDPTIIEAWWAKWPEASIGCPTGGRMGAWVLDVDQPHGPPSLMALEAKHGLLPPTKEQRTGGGGRQLFFRWPPGRMIRNSASKLAPGLDVRGEGGYVILPPSGHLSGGKYAWEANGFDEYLDASAWLLDMVSPPPKDGNRPLPVPYSGQSPTTAYGRKALEEECATVARAQQGTRNQALNTAAFALGQLVAGGEIAPQEAESALFAAAQCAGLPQPEAQRTIRSGLTAGQKEPRSSNSPAPPLTKEGDYLPPGTMLNVLTCRELLDMELPKRGFVLEPILKEQGLAMMYAPRGLGKTWAALTMAYAIASGQQVFGFWRAGIPRRVLYLDGEMPASTIQERLAAIAAGIPDAEPAHENLRILTPDLQGEYMPNIATPEGQKALAPHLKGIDVVIVDNIATLCRAGKENEAESWLPVQAWLLRLRREGKTVILIHHAGKGGAQRGTSAREDILDTVIAMKRPEDYQAEEGARFEVHLEKARGLCGPEASPFEARLLLDNGAAVWDTRPLSDVEVERVKALKAEGLSIRDIAEETGLSRSKVGRIVKRLETS